MEERIISGEISNFDERFEQSLRPQFLSQYIGQEKVKDNLGIFIEAAKGRSESLDHVLLYGPPGLGKTTLPHPEPISSTRWPGCTLGQIEDAVDLAVLRRQQVVTRFEPGRGCTSASGSKKELEEVVGQVIVAMDVLPSPGRGVLLGGRRPALPRVPQGLQGPGHQDGHPAAENPQHCRELIGRRVRQPASKLISGTRRCGALAPVACQPPVVISPVIHASPKPIRPSAPNRAKKSAGRSESRRGPPAPHVVPSGKARVIGRFLIAALASFWAIAACTGAFGISNNPGHTPADGRGMARGRLGLSSAMVVLPLLSYLGVSPMGALPVSRAGFYLVPVIRSKALSGWVGGLGNS